MVRTNPFFLKKFRYEEFSKSYDYMIIEIDRRNRVKEQHEKIAEEYLAKLDALYIGIYLCVII